MELPFSSRKHHEDCGPKTEAEFLQEIVNLLQQIENQLRSINTSCNLIGATDGVIQQLVALNETAKKTLIKETEMAMTVTAIQGKVQEETTVIQSAVTLMGQLSNLIRANADDPVALQQIADSIDANKQSLADAVVANTPAA